MACKICGQDVAPVFKTTLLNKYEVEYLKCKSCGFMQTESPHWLEESYSEAITALDLGYATRNVRLGEMTNSIIRLFFDKKDKFIDFGGGYGLFVRLMRDKGLDFYRQDEYCKNIFSDHFDVEDLPKSTKFEVLTAFEVFEHLLDPLVEIEKMFSFSDSLLFSTELQPHENISKPEDWWYFVPEIGQHIAFYNKKSLQFIADKFGCNLYTNGKNLHLLTKKKFMLNPVKTVFYPMHLRDMLLSRHFQNGDSLLENDTRHIKAILKKEA